jgi:CMP-N,N'-diacetyllegionaminic acid synthase
MKIIIPARLGSKGLPFKNRTLFKYTADSIPVDRAKDTIVTTDDPEIVKLATEYGFTVIERPSHLGEDTTSTRDVIFHAIKELHISDSDFVIMLYLTYPERTWEEVMDAFNFFLDHSYSGNANSLLCKKEVKTHPYLCLEEYGADGIFGRQITKHDLYRRQDYPKCFEISHYISIFKAGAIYKLNRNLYCEETVFYPIPEVIDVDTKKELDQFNGK